ncbi:MAG: ferredoxin-NADP reductase [Epulopiscium sp. Nuni2H_MBin003]|nr:MAG: ferredoxin-NADP reductase [Epulopiscium sp. Nuni2H_MBin003]
MYKILEKERLSSQVVKMKIDAPHVAKKALAGQFIILRVDEVGERIPLTIADYDREAGTTTIIFQEVGYSTIKLGQKNAGDYLIDFVGPLGIASHVDEYKGKNICVIGGGLGCAIAYPQAKAFYNAGANVDVIAGFRNSDFIILEKEMAAVSNKLSIVTDDGSNGHKGLVTDVLNQSIADGANYDLVIAIGPLVMMKFVCLATKPHNIKTLVSMNSTMVDGTGMCGCCRLTVDGKTKFACVDGPDFDGHLVDFDETIRKASMYKEHERNQCNLEGMKNA